MFDEIEENILPQALMIGVDYDLFWSLNPKSLKPFIKAFSLKEQHQDRMLWIEGMYIRMAVASTLNKSAKYPTKPYFDKTKKREMSPKEIQDRFLTQAKIINNRLGKEGV